MAFWSALESMAFCEGCLEFRDEPLFLPLCDRFREWPLDLRLSPRSLDRWRPPGEAEAGDGDMLAFAVLDRDGDRLCVGAVVESHADEK